MLIYGITKLAYVETVFLCRDLNWTRCLKPSGLRIAWKWSEIEWTTHLYRSHIYKHITSSYIILPPKKIQSISWCSFKSWWPWLQLRDCRSLHSWETKMVPSSSNGRPDDSARTFFTKSSTLCLANMCCQTKTTSSLYHLASARACRWNGNFM